MRNGIWASPGQHRDQCTLFAPSLEDMIASDHPVRRLEELLLQVDWNIWEAARARIDFMWLLHAMKIDHSTFAAFRAQFEDELEDLFKQLAVIALKGNMDVELAVDGTRVRANSSRPGALGAAAIERRAQQIAAQLSEALEKTKQADLLDDPGCRSAAELEREIAGLEAQQAKLAHALQRARLRDEAKAGKADKRRAGSARVPLTDPDSHVLQNKEGGYGPNYTPTAAVDTASGVILAASVPEGSKEASVVGDAVAAAREITTGPPERILFDSAFAAGANLESLGRQGIDAYAPGGAPKRDNPAIRPDPTAPVPADKWDALPKQGKKRRVLTREAFVYDREQDCCWCPMGRKLPLARRLKAAARRAHAEIAEYVCEDCADCPLARRCLSRQAKHRRISRDQYEAYREDLRERMQTEAAQQIYRRRAPTAEGVFGHIKRAMGIRQFLRRGLDNVRSEWLWICAAYNVSRILGNACSVNAANSPARTAVSALAGPLLRLLQPDRRQSAVGLVA